MADTSPTQNPAEAVETGRSTADPGPLRNTALQLASQLSSAAFTAGLTLYLVRRLGASGYGTYALAYSVGALAVLLAGAGLPPAVGRFLAEHRGDPVHVRAILAVGLKIQVPAATLTGVGLFALASPLAHAFGNPHLVWPLRWMGVGVIAMALFTFFTTMFISVRRVSAGLWMVILESATETAAAIAFVLGGAGAAGALLGKAIGYTVALTVGLLLALRVFGRGRGGRLPTSVRPRSVVGYAGALFAVDATWAAIAQVDVLIVGAVLTSAAVGRFGAVLRILTVLGYLGIAVTAGVAPRVARGKGRPDTDVFNQAIRYLLIVQGLVIAPMLVWSGPIIGLLLGRGYGGAADILRVLSIYAFIGAPAALISGAVDYLGEARRRLVIMFGTLTLGLALTYALVRTVGVVGAAVADDVIQVAYVAAHVWLCSRLIDVDLRRLAKCVVRTLIAAAAMTLPLLAFGTKHLGVGAWIAGLVASIGLYGAVLLATRELSIAELHAIARRIRLVLPGGTSGNVPSTSSA